MFMHIFKYRLKKLLRTREVIFWTLAFPIILSILFNLAFANLDSSEAFEPFSAAVVNDENYESNVNFKSVLKEVSTGDDRLMNLREVSKTEAEELLTAGEISGYMESGDQIKLYVSSSGLNQNILRLFLDNYNQTFFTVENILKENPQKVQSLMAEVSEVNQYTKEAVSENAPPSQILNYFYTLIAMSCLYGFFFGSDEVTDIQANISARAARINIAPVHKMKAFLSSMAASLLIHLMCMGTLLLFMAYVLKIDFGNRVGYIILTTFMGSMTGLTFGAFVSALVKKSENLKVAIAISVTMTGSFLAGMMYAQMKYLVMQNVPILAYINPVNLITDALYTLYYYSDLNRYFFNIFMLFILSLVFSIGTYLILRRRRYASI
ncbi:MAG: ABC transporter permease [Clostridiaceae bacterium]